MRIGCKRTAVLFIAAIVACLLVGYAFVWCGQTANHRAYDRISSVGGKVIGDTEFGYTTKVKNVTYSWGGGTPGRLYHILWWTYYSEPKAARFVDLSQCRLTNADCKAISAVRNATILNLRDASLPSDGLAYLVAIPTLEVVDLRGVAISSDILQILKRNDSLRAVVVTPSLVDPKIIREFALDMPNCEIISE
jgi:hypothetical protein